MICYRDMTFCPYYAQCESGFTCYRAYTVNVRKMAKSSTLPVAVFNEPSECLITLPEEVWD